MTEPWAAQLAIIERPRLSLEALYALRSTINGALLSLSPATPMREESDDRSTGRQAPTRFACVPVKHTRSEPHTIQAEVTSLLKLLMAAHLAVDVALPREAVNE
jgi:hypothetical protein